MKKALMVFAMFVLACSVMSQGGGLGAFSALVGASDRTFMEWAGVRTRAMGGVSVALEDQGATATWNPAYCTALCGRVPLIGQDLSELGTSLQYLGLSLSTTGFGGGVGWARFAVSGATISSEGKMKEDVTWVEQVLTTAIEARLANGLTGGSKVNYYFDDSGLGDKAFGIGVDLGVAVPVAEGYTFRVSGRDLSGTVLNWEGGATDLIAGQIMAGLSTCVGRDAVDTKIGDLANYMSADSLALRGGATLRDGSVVLAGVNLRWGEELDAASGYDARADIGLLLRLGRVLALGLEARDLRLLASEAPAGIGGSNCAAGVALHFDHSPIWGLGDGAVLAADVEWQQSDLRAVRFGAEYNWRTLKSGIDVAVRGGTKLDLQSKSHAFTLGVALETRSMSAGIAYVSPDSSGGLLLLDGEVSLDWLR